MFPDKKALAEYCGAGSRRQTTTARTCFVDLLGRLRSQVDVGVMNSRQLRDPARSRNAPVRALPEERMTLRSPISAATPMCRCGRRIPFRPPRPTGLLAMLLAGIVTGMAVADDPRVELRHIGTIDEPLIREPSGLVRSRQYPGVFWILSDSGNPPFLYAIQRTGKVIARYHIVDAVNLDWEALAADDRGNLFVADVGNNVSLPRRWIYRLREPNPNAPDRNYLRDVKIRRSHGVSHLMTIRSTSRLRSSGRTVCC